MAERGGARWRGLSRARACLAAAASSGRVQAPAVFRRRPAAHALASGEMWRALPGLPPCRNLFEGGTGEVDLSQQAGEAQPALPAAAGGRRSTAQGAGGRAGQGPRSPSVAPLPEQSDTHLIPLELEPGDEYLAGEGEAGTACVGPCLWFAPVLKICPPPCQRIACWARQGHPHQPKRPCLAAPSHGPSTERPLADPSLLLTIEGWTVRRGKLVPVPSFYCQVGPSGGGVLRGGVLKGAGRAVSCVPRLLRLLCHAATRAGAGPQRAARHACHPRPHARRRAGSRAAAPRLAAPRSCRPRSPPSPGRPRSGTWWRGGSRGSAARARAECAGCAALLERPRQRTRLSC